MNRGFQERGLKNINISDEQPSCYWSLSSEFSQDAFSSWVTGITLQMYHKNVLPQHFRTSHIQHLQREHAPKLRTKTHRKHKCILRFTSPSPTNLIVIRFLTRNDYFITNSSLWSLLLEKEILLSGNCHKHQKMCNHLVRAKLQKLVAC